MSELNVTNSVGNGYAGYTMVAEQPKREPITSLRNRYGDNPKAMKNEGSAKGDSLFDKATVEAIKIELKETPALTPDEMKQAAATLKQQPTPEEMAAIAKIIDILKSKNANIVDKENLKKSLEDIPEKDLP